MQCFSPVNADRAPTVPFSLQICVLALSVSLPGSLLYADEEHLPDTLQLSDFPGRFIEEVIVPHPGELFSLMDKLPGRSDWAGRV
ncbi:MAG: hypothetical protein AAF191_08995, partial [Verrucomicrobiota bacterium]